MARPNKRTRQARAKKRQRVENENANRSLLAESIPTGRGLGSNTKNWEKSPAFRGIGWNAKGSFARGESSY